MSPESHPLDLDPSAAPIYHSARRISAIGGKINAKNYLEIGVAAGRTFFSVDIQKKTAVDPHFRFDWKSKQTADVKFFEMPSDAWFLNHSHGERFDLIFLDGLHTFEQTFRDFCNSVSVAHDKTVWIIDDTVPLDIYSTRRSQKEAIEFRKEASGRDKVRGAWHGDVYKTVFAIHDFFPMMSYCTVLDSGNPQTVLWRKPRTDFVPRFDNLEQISRLDYFDFKKNFDTFHGLPEAEALRVILESI